MSRNIAGSQRLAADAALKASAGACGPDCYGPPCFRCLRLGLDTAASAPLRDVVEFIGVPRHQLSR
jgi:hypothetical protein